MFCFLRRYLLPIYIFIASLATSPAAQSETALLGSFLFPNPNITDPSAFPIYNYHDTVNASWVSRYEAPWLHLWCDANGTFYIVQNVSIPANGSKLVPLEPANNSMCHFQLTPLAVDAVDDSTINSGVFNVTKYEGIKPTTYAAPGAASNGDPSASSSLSTATPSTGTPDPSHHASSSGLSTGAKAGIGVGVAVGVLCLLAAVLFLVVTARRKKRRQAQPPNATENLMMESETKPVGAPAAWIEGNAVQPGLTNVIKQEIDGEEIKLELDGGAATTTAVAAVPPGELEADSTRATANSNGPANKS